MSQIFTVSAALLIVIGTLQAQNPTSSAGERAASVINQAQIAVGGSTIAPAIDLNASATWIAGSTHETGTAELKAKGIAQSRLDVLAGAVVRSEIINARSEPGGEWLDGNGAAHRYAQHNCWTTAAWFSPSALLEWAQQADAVVTYVGREVRDGTIVDHLHAYRAVVNQPAADAAVLERLTSEDVYIAADSHLPVALIFNTHADNDINREMPIEILYSDYRLIDGVQVPFHIQRYIENTLNLDLVVTAATTTAKLSDNDFEVQ